MELFEARDHFIIQNGEHALWCNRFDGSLTARRGSDICTAWNPVCLGVVQGVIGKMKIHPESEWKLLLIRQQSRVGALPGGAEIFKINKITILPLCLDEPKDLDIELCHKHHFGISKPNQIATKVPDTQQKALAKTWNSIKSAAENVKPKKHREKHEDPKIVEKRKRLKREVKEKEKFERRVIEELSKMFLDSDSFYYSREGDLTNSIQRQHLPGYDRAAPLWSQADDRFFWNKYMLQDLINSQDSLADQWIVPIMQGYVQVEMCSLDMDDADDNSLSDMSTRRSPSPIPPASPKDPINYQISLISRRSRHRAGTRYKRRGVDEQGHVANYVETEQILEFSWHVVSFVQIRGSVPVYWSQTGIKYRPPPRIEKGEKENQEVFSKHFNRDLDTYHKIGVVNVVDQAGKEKVMADTYLQHILLYNSHHLAYIAFDFHEYCRGMKFENVSILIDNIREVIKDMRYCWVDKKGMICDQQGVFRINCIDCLDRTNIVQSAIAKIILETQCRKLGLLPPDEQLPTHCRSLYQQMWANNGDALSRQYAGTQALKGDYTRTGERNLKGLMKDGMNSANRYYINRVKDVYRQATIDLMLGNEVHEDIAALTAAAAAGKGEDEDQVLLREKEENLKTLIDECKKMLVTEPEDCLGGWGLIDCDPVTGDPTQQDTDIILLLSQRAYYVAKYDDESDQVTSYYKIFLEDLEKIEVGPAPALFKSKHMCIRIFHQVEGEAGFFHSFRPTSTRLFNNMVVTIKNEEEAKECLRAISESFTAARKLSKMELEVIEGKLERKRTKPHSGLIDIATTAQINSWARTSTPISRENSRTNLKAAGANLRNVLNIKRNPALNMARIGKTFAGLNPISKVKMGRLKPPGFMPAVLYRKADDHKDPAGSNTSLEHAKILKGDHIITTEEAFSTDKDKPVDLTLDEVDLRGSRIDVDPADEEGDILLESCGILAVKPPLLLASMLQEDRARSASVLFSQTKHQRTASMKSPIQRRKDRMSAQSKSKSLDIEETYGRMGERLFVDKSRVDILTPQTEESRSPPSSVTSPKQSSSNGTPPEGHRSPPQITMIPPEVTVMSPDDGGDDSGITMFGGGQRAPNVVCPTPIKPDMLDAKGTTAEQQAAAEVANGGVKFIGGSQVTSDEVMEPAGPPIMASPSQSDIDESWVNVEYADAPEHSELFHPCMKMSLSDGSICYHNDLEALGLMNTGDMKVDAAGAGAFSRFRVKMSNLALPTIPSPQTKRRLMEQAALQNKMKSQLRFKECKSQIILL